MRVAVWRLYYRIRRYFKPDEAWERDMAGSRKHRLPFYIAAFVVFIIIIIAAWRPYERWAIDEAIEGLVR